MAAVREGYIFFGLIVLVFFIIQFIQSRMIKSSGKIPEIRHMAAMDALDDAVGRAAETGRPIHFTSGIRGEISYGLTYMNLAGISIMSHVAKEAAIKGARMITSTANEDYLPLIHELQHQAALAAGKPEMFNESDHHYFPEQSYTVGVTNLMERERIAANVMVGGADHVWEIMCEVAARQGAFQVIGNPGATAGGFLQAFSDYFLVGEENYVAGAYLSKDISQLGVVAGSDTCKWVIVGLIAVAIVAATAGITVPWY